jgi:hypothetical protein
MSRPQRIAQYIQRLAYESLIDHEDADVRPNDAPPRAPEPKVNYATWDSASYSMYAPFRAPTNS